MGARLQANYLEPRGSYEQSNVRGIANEGPGGGTENRDLKVVGLGEYGNGLALQLFAASHGFSRGSSAGILTKRRLSKIDSIRQFRKWNVCWI